MKHFIKLTLVLTLTLASCSSSSYRSDMGGRSNSDSVAKNMLQGIWFLADSDAPFLKVHGDSLRFYEQPDIKIYFEINNDSLFTYNNHRFGYKVDKQSDYFFWFHSLSNHMVKLYKSENDEDSLYFESQDVADIAADTTQQVIENDTIIYHGNDRYHGYSFINPSSYKVYKPLYSDEGIRINQVYYDNIVYICVYSGKDKLFGQNVSKADFKSLLDNEFYENVILADMNFTGVDDNWFYYVAKIEIPNSFIYDLIDVRIDRATGVIHYQHKE